MPSLRDDVQTLLLDKIRETRYPSLELMNRYEATVRDLDHAREYVQVLLEKVQQDTYPSLQLLDRVVGFIDLIERAELVQRARQAQWEQVAERREEPDRVAGSRAG